MLVILSILGECCSTLVLQHLNVPTGHSLVIPKQHYVTLDQVPADLSEKCFSIVPSLARAILKATSTTAWNIMQNNTRVAGQEVRIIHSWASFVCNLLPMCIQQGRSRALAHYSSVQGRLHEKSICKRTTISEQQHNM